MSNWLKATCASLVAVFAPVHAVMLTAGFLVCADLFTGVWAAKKEGKKITSARLRDSVSKMILFQIGIVSGFLIETYMIDKALPIVKIISVAIAFSEGKSLFENLDRIHGGGLFKSLLKKIGSKSGEDV